MQFVGIIDGGTLVLHCVLVGAISHDVGMEGDISYSVLRVLLWVGTSIFQVQAHIHAEVHIVVSVGGICFETDVVLVEFIVAHIS